MHKLVGHPGTIVSREQLKEKFWDLTLTDNTIKQHDPIRSLSNFSLINDVSYARKKGAGKVRQVKKNIGFSEDLDGPIIRFGR